MKHVGGQNASGSACDVGFPIASLQADRLLLAFCTALSDVAGPPLMRTQCCGAIIVEVARTTLRALGTRTCRSRT